LTTQRDSSRLDAHLKDTQREERDVTLRLVGIDPDTNGDNCPAVFVDQDTGDLVLQGWTETDSQALAEVADCSPIADHESVVRLPARMRDIITEAVRGSQGPAIQ
jgi:hypothetical protein